MWVCMGTGGPACQHLRAPAWPLDHVQSTHYVLEVGVPSKCTYQGGGGLPSLHLEESFSAVQMGGRLEMRICGEASPTSDRWEGVAILGGERRWRWWLRCTILSTEGRDR